MSVATQAHRLVLLGPPRERTAADRVVRRRLSLVRLGASADADRRLAPLRRTHD